MSQGKPATPEFSCMIDRRHLTAAPVELKADADERAALAARFGLVAIDSLAATVELSADGDAVEAKGRLKAAIVQSCAISGDDLPVKIDEPIVLRFVPERGVEEEELELEEGELDEIPYAGHQFDLGEAIAQSLTLAIDPYATGPNAEAARQAAGLRQEGASGPLAEALAALKKS